jgi:hypothetical protein
VHLKHGLVNARPPFRSTSFRFSLNLSGKSACVVASVEQYFRYIRNESMHLNSNSANMGKNKYYRKTVGA